MRITITIVASTTACHERVHVARDADRYAPIDVRMHTGNRKRIMHMCERRNVTAHDDRGDDCNIEVCSAERLISWIALKGTLKK